MEIAAFSKPCLLQEHIRYGPGAEETSDLIRFTIRFNVFETWTLLLLFTKRGSWAVNVTHFWVCHLHLLKATSEGADKDLDLLPVCNCDKAVSLSPSLQVCVYTQEDLSSISLPCVIQATC